MSKLLGYLTITIALVFSGVLIVVMMNNLTDSTANAAGSIGRAPAGEGEGLVHDGPAIAVEAMDLRVNGVTIPAAVIAEQVGSSWDAGEVLCIAGCIVQGDASVLLEVGDGSFATTLLGPPAAPDVTRPAVPEVPSAQVMP